TERCDLTDIVSSALRRLEPLTRGRPIDAGFPDTPLFIEADYAQIETVVVNLLENALKYSPPGTLLLLRGRVATSPARRTGPSSSASESRRVARFVLRDEGPGVRPEDRKR